MQLLALLGALALLICNAAAGLASRLAGGLALAASAVLCACAKVLCFDSLNMLHDKPPNYKFLLIISHKKYNVNIYEKNIFNA